MNPKYLFFAVIPALFITASCVREKPKIEEFFTFSTEQKNEMAAQEKAVDVAVVTKTTPKEEAKKPEKPATEQNKLDGDNILKKYNIGYLTFDVADLYAEIKPIETTPDYTRYRFRLYSKTNGFVDYVFGWMSYTASTMKVYKNKVVPEAFKTKATLKKKTREIAMDYDSSGQKITYEIVTPPDNRYKRPAVKYDLKTGTFDPLSIVMETRRIVMDVFKNNKFNDKGVYSFSLPLYDGRKRTDVNFEIQNRKVNGFYPLKFVMVPVGGYTDNELKDIAKGERVITLYIETENFTPVNGVGKSPIGSARAKFTGYCNTEFLEECVKQGKEKSGNAKKN